MGGFTKIYPLDVTNSEENGRLMEKYDYLISIEDDLNSKKKDREPDKA